MTDIMIQISTYIFIAILLGFVFGWIVARILSTEKAELEPNRSSHEDIDQSELLKLKDDLFQLKRDNKLLRTKNKDLNLGYKGQKYVLEEHNATLDDFQKRLLNKDEIIETLTKKLSLVEEEQRRIEKKYETEIDAFMFERIEITKKYQDIREKYNLLKQTKKGLANNSSWISRWFLPS